MTLADEKYVAFTTFKKDGTPKSLPVWIADLGDGTMGFTTNDQSWKVKRLRNNPNVELQPSDAKGVPTSGSSVTKGTATVLSAEADFNRVRSNIKAKYGWQVTLVIMSGKIAGLFGRHMASNCAIVITPG